jgi:RNA polymerase sigma-70 factor (ECF subfamily)
VAARERPSDADLMRGIRRGDETAFRALFERHEASLAKLVRRIVSDGMLRKVSVADILQETRMHAYGGREGYDPAKGSPAAWLVGIARHRALEAARRHGGAEMRRFQREVTRGNRKDTADFAHPGPSPSEAAVSLETAERVRAAMDALPDDYREVLRLARLEGLSLREVAERMGRSREAVKKLYGRALCRCRQVFLKLGEGDHV